MINDKQITIIKKPIIDFMKAIFSIHVGQMRLTDVTEIVIIFYFYFLYIDISMLILILYIFLPYFDYLRH